MDLTSNRYSSKYVARMDNSSDLNQLLSYAKSELQDAKYWSKPKGDNPNNDWEDYGKVLIQDIMPEIKMGKTSTSEAIAAIRDLYIKMWKLRKNNESPNKNAEKIAHAKYKGVIIYVKPGYFSGSIPGYYAEGYSKIEKDPKKIMEWIDQKQNESPNKNAEKIAHAKYKGVIIYVKPGYFSGSIPGYYAEGYSKIEKDPKKIMEWIDQKQNESPNENGENAELVGTYKGQKLAVKFDGGDGFWSKLTPTGKKDPKYIAYLITDSGPYEATGKTKQQAIEAVKKQYDQILQHKEKQKKEYFEKKQNSMENKMDLTNNRYSSQYVARMDNSEQFVISPAYKLTGIAADVLFGLTDVQYKFDSKQRAEQVLKDAKAPI